MVRHPDVYKKAQKEIDHVIGNGRLPTIDDRPSLPYLDSLIREVLRWNPPAPMGLPHRVIEDDIYEGCHIPKGTTVIANIYAVMQACPQPDVLRPERTTEDPNLPDPHEFVFGFGRRICPGRHLAEYSIWYLVASITATLNISRVLDRDGKEIIPPFDVTQDLIRLKSSSIIIM